MRDPRSSRPGSPEAATLQAAVEAVARDLARQQAADGEGATTLLTCQVTRRRPTKRRRVPSPGPSCPAACSRQRSTAAIPNWGRIAGAAGNARLAEAPVLEAAGHAAPTRPAAVAVSRRTLDPDRLRIAIAGTTVFDGANGGAQPFDKGAVRAGMDAAGDDHPRWTSASATAGGEAFGCDLTEEYVRENSEYST